jgi:hypothetical protein
VQLLNIPCEGKSATSLASAIDATAKASSGQSAEAPLGPSGLNQGLLSSYFKDQIFTDCEIHVSLLGQDEDSVSGRPEKRLRVEEGTEMTEAKHAPVDRVIRAHAVILATRSKYFERAMQGAWRESTDKRIEITLTNEEGM